MRYKNNNKAERNKELKAYRKAHPKLSLEEIGDHFGITKQRVSRLLQKFKNKKGS